jgi:hypothetical protein
MATMVLLASYLALNGVNRSTWASKIELTIEVEDKDVTTYGSLGWKEVKGGLKSGTLGATFKNDYADDQLDETMWALLGTVVSFEVRADNAAVSASNPKYTGNVLVKKWVPITGTVGDVAEVDVEYPTSGAVTRAVA